MRNGNQKGIFQVGSAAGLLAVLALMTTITAFAMAGVMGGEGAEQLLPQIAQNNGIFLTAFIAVAAISLFDIFTVPGLYLVAKDGSQSLALGAAILAVVGDLFGVTGGVIQLSLLRLSTAFASTADLASILASAQLVEVLESVLSKAGFLLVGPSFLLFGIALLKSGAGKWFGWVGIAAGILTSLGLIPPLAILSLIANLLYVVWYVILSVKFFKFAR